MKTTGVPSLYVKSFACKLLPHLPLSTLIFTVRFHKAYGGPEMAIRDIFKKARETAPCLLILEDLDSLIDDRNRSFFLNELDGLESNVRLYLSVPSRQRPDHLSIGWDSPYRKHESS